MTIDNEIRREIMINAPMERVWELISEPGWWVNSGEIRAHEITEVPGQDNVVRVTDPEYGDFTLEIVASRPPHEIAYRWLGGAGDGESAVVSTLITFTTQETDDGVLLQVVESGWADVEPSEKVASEYQENAHGWAVELHAAQKHLERS